MKNKRILVCALALAAGGSGASAQSTPPDPSGDWRGSITAGGTTQRIALHLGAKPTFDILERNAIGVPAEMTVNGTHVAVSVGGARLFEGEIGSDGHSLDGVMKGGPTDIPIHFERGVFAAANRPQTPRPPFPYNVAEVGFDNPRQPGIHLAGTLTTPQGAGPFPAVLLITGSGSQDRDETIFEHKPFLVLADALTRRGIAVLRLDDRGIGGSTAGPPSATTADLATDATTAIAWLRTRHEIDPKRIGMLGHSEGGIIAAMVASEDSKIAFVVLWAGPGARGKETVVEQVRAIALSSGARPAQAEQAAALQSALLDAVMRQQDSAATRAAIDAVTQSHGVPAIGNADFAQLTSPGYRYFLALDPAPALRKVQAPVLALLGSKDAQVDANLNGPILRAALAGNPKATVETLPGLNHLFQKAVTGAPGEYGTIEQTIDPAALNRAVEWIAATTGRKP